MADSALPADLARALAWLRAHFRDPTDLEQLASVAGVRPRTLEKRFRAFVGTTPLACVRRMRLAQARREILCARSGATITEIAGNSGFMQLGRFSARYRAAFGEAPSATLRRQRRAAAQEAVDDEAVRLTWQAMSYAFAIAPQECNRALEHLALAQERAPHYGLPVAVAAWCWGQRAAHGFSATPHEDRARSLRLARQASALAHDDPLALTLASGALTLAHRLREADQLLERALVLDPWLPYAWVRRGWASVYSGDAPGGLQELAVALQLNPAGPMRNIACIGVGSGHFATGRYDQAVRWVCSGTEAFPGAVWADRLAVAAAAHAGAKDEALRMGRCLLHNDPDLTAERARSAWPFPPGFMARLADGLVAAGVPRS